jgi:hypothetical protein
MINGTFVDDIVRRSSRRTLMFGMIGLIALIGAHVLSARYYYNFFLGPFEIDEDTLLEMEDWNSRLEYYVNVVGEDSYDTGFTYVTTSDSGSETTDYSYVELEIDRDSLLVQVPGELDSRIPEAFTGSLVSITDEIQREVVDELRGRFLPYMLDTSDFKTMGYVGLVGTAVVGLACLYLIFTGLGRLSNPNRHPAVKALGRFGDPQTIAQQMHHELSGSHPQVGNLHFTRHWVINKSGASLDVTRPQDVVWIYKKVTQHRTNGIPTGKTYAALIYDRHGKIMTIPGKEPIVNEMLTATYQNAPWAEVGFSAEIEKMWNKNRQQLIDNVQQRAVSYKQSS